MCVCVYLCMDVRRTLYVYFINYIVTYVHIFVKYDKIHKVIEQIHNRYSARMSLSNRYIV